MEIWGKHRSLCWDMVCTGWPWLSVPAIVDRLQSPSPSEQNQMAQSSFPPGLGKGCAGTTIQAPWLGGGLSRAPLGNGSSAVAELMCAASWAFSEAGLRSGGLPGWGKALQTYTQLPRVTWLLVTALLMGRQVRGKGRKDKGRGAESTLPGFALLSPLPRKCPCPHGSTGATWSSCCHPAGAGCARAQRSQAVFSVFAAHPCGMFRAHPYSHRNMCVSVVSTRWAWVCRPTSRQQGGV